MVGYYRKTRCGRALIRATVAKIRKPSATDPKSRLMGAAHPIYPVSENLGHRHQDYSEIFTVAPMWVIDT